MLTLREELSMLGELREIGSNVVTRDYYESLLKAKNGIAWFDQYDQASRETKNRTLKLAETSDLQHATYPDPHKFGPEVLAAVIRCVAGSHCPHVSAGDRPLTGFLAARVITCDRCVLRYRGALAASEQRVKSGADALCDFCLTEPDDNWFHQSAVQFGPITLLGDVCRSCLAKAGG